MNGLCLCVIPGGIFFEMSALLILVWSQMKNNTEKDNFENGNFNFSACGIRNIARIANAVQVTICVLVSTSVY